jgi:hypothetical protein
VFFTGMALEWGVLTPWSLRFSRHLAAHDTLSAADAGETIDMLLASLPVGALEIVGATAACAGASRVFGISHETVNTDIPDVKVWVPYEIGWICRALGDGLGFLAGLSKNNNLSLVGSGFSLLGEASWTTSTIMSIVYSGRWRNDAQMKLFITPTYAPHRGSGLVLGWNF